jgi:hypothetical protein
VKSLLDAWVFSLHFPEGCGHILFNFCKQPEYSRVRSLRIQELFDISIVTVEVGEKVSLIERAYCPSIDYSQARKRVLDAIATKWDHHASHCLLASVRIGEFDVDMLQGCQ